MSTKVQITKPTAIVCDIEGTTTSVRFWTDVMAPFIIEQLPHCLNERWHAQSTVDVITLLRNKCTQDEVGGGGGGGSGGCITSSSGNVVTKSAAEHHSPIIPTQSSNTSTSSSIPVIVNEDAPQTVVIESVCRYVNYLTKHRQHQKENKKCAKVTSGYSELRAVHLMVWLYGYQSSLLKGHVYADVAVAFEQWKSTTSTTPIETTPPLQIYLYANSITLAQRLLMCNTTSGDLTKWIDDYLSTETLGGNKNDPQSYLVLAKYIGHLPSRCLYLSDNVVEVKAAKVAGFQAILVLRTHNRDSSGSGPSPGGGGGSGGGADNFAINMSNIRSIKSFEDLEFR